MADVLHAGKHLANYAIMCGIIKGIIHDVPC